MSTTEHFWNKAAEKYAKKPIKDIPAYNQTIERTKSYLSKSDRVLEIGCGTGSTALLLAGSVKHITGSDISSKMIEIARRKAKDQQIGNVEFVRSPLFDDTFEEGSFDSIMAFNLMHLLEEPAAAIRRAGELLKPEGLFISKTICMAGQSKFWRVLIFIMEKLGVAPYVNFLKTRELEELVTNEGFRIIETGTYPAFPPSRFIVARKV